MENESLSKFFLTSALILVVACAISSNSNYASISFLTGNAYGQSPPDAGTGSDLGAPGDNSTGLPGDNSSSLGTPGDLGPPGSSLPGDNSTGLGAPGDLGAPAGNLTDLGPGPIAENTTTQNTTLQNSSSSTVPEFGSLSAIVLAMSVTGVILFGAKRSARF